jgi:serine/threonine protein kinase
MTDLVGKTVRGYQIKDHIGSGGFGVVYRAFQPAINREVAIKVILPTRARSEHFVKRFDAEAQLVAKLEHPFIVPLYEYWHDDERAYLVMRWLHGGSLRTPLDQGPLDSASIAKIIHQIGDALTLAHKNGVVHRDLKPGNILLDGEGNYYLTDFGIAKDLTGEIYESTGTGITGSPAYISPEQGLSENITHLADIYSFGVLLYEMLTGEHPFPDVGTTAQILHHISDPLPPLSDKRPDLPQELNEVIQTATEKRPGARYQNISDFSKAYQAAAEGRKTPQQTRTRSHKRDSPLSAQKARKLLLALTAIVMFALLVVGLLLRPSLFPSQTPSQPTSTPTHPPPQPSPIPTSISTTPQPTTESFFIGQSVLGNPIQATRLGNGERILILVAALHGSEANASNLLEELTENYQTNSLPDGLTLYIVPKANPDGLLADTRLNSHDVDLNRNWDTTNWTADSRSPFGTIAGGGGTAPFSEPETAAISTWLLELAAVSSQPLTVLFYHSAFPPSGFVQPSYTLSGQSLVSNPFASAYGQAYAAAVKAEFSNTWDDYDITGEALLWCGENEIICLDIELPSLNNITNAELLAHLEALSALFTTLLP